VLVPWDFLEKKGSEQKAESAVNRNRERRRMETTQRGEGGKKRHIQRRTEVTDTQKKKKERAERRAGRRGEEGEGSSGKNKTKRRNPHEGEPSWQF
jgi:hypothetical protein